MGKVLIVDDEPSIADYLSRLIKTLGHQTGTSLSAVQALSNLQNETYDLIIADICLPDAPAPEQWIQQLSHHAAGKPIVLISGIPSTELNDMATAYGVLAFLTKPFELAFIKNILKTAIGT